MCCVVILILTTFIAVTVGQVSIVSDKNNVQDDERVVLTCTAPDFNDNVFIIQDTTSKAFCLVNDSCSTNTSIYSAVKSGTNIVIFSILSFSKERDEGSWKIRYATATDSTPLTLSALSVGCSRRRRSATNNRKCAGNKSQAAVNKVQPYILGGLVAMSVYVIT